MDILHILASAEAEPSKTVFYVIGGAFAAWAVVLSAIGLTQPGFPGSGGRARVAMALSVGLAVAAMASAVITS